MENSHKESLLSAVEDFTPPPSPTPADFSDSDRDEGDEEELLSSGARPYMFKQLSTAGGAAEPAETQAHAGAVWSCSLLLHYWQYLYDRGDRNIWERIFGQKTNVRPRVQDEPSIFLKRFPGNA